MLFIEPIFFLFLTVVLAVFWTMNSWRLKKTFLLIASYVFYGFWSWKFLSLLVASSVLDYYLGSALAKPTLLSRQRKGLLALSLASNLGCLAYFKYANFFIESAVELSKWFGMTTAPSSLNIILPVGISFYTFQSLSYVIDIYRRKIEGTASLLDFLLYVAFFPQLVAGPIVRASSFLTQLTDRPRQWDEIQWRAAITLFLIGFIKKVCLADNFALFADRVFESDRIMAPLQVWGGILSYAIQIYGDFSGYSDMAIALAAMLGFRLPINFNNPYLALNIRDFWRRWHISLSTWFQDYVYFPLGGSRKGRWRGHINRLLTMTLCGLWHGSSWHFVAWGIFHGIALVLYHELHQLKSGFLSRVPSVFSMAMTFLTVNLGWVLFRSEDLNQAGRIYQSALLNWNGFVIGSSSIWILLATVAVASLLVKSVLQVSSSRNEWWIQDAVHGLLIAIAILTANPGYAPFVYFQF